MAISDIPLLDLATGVIACDPTEQPTVAAISGTSSTAVTIEPGVYEFISPNATCYAKFGAAPVAVVIEDHPIPAGASRFFRIRVQTKVAFITELETGYVYWVECNGL